MFRQPSVEIGDVVDHPPADLREARALAAARPRGARSIVSLTIVSGAAGPWRINRLPHLKVKLPRNFWTAMPACSPPLPNLMSFEKLGFRAGWSLVAAYNLALFARLGALKRWRRTDEFEPVSHADDQASALCS